MTEGLLPGASSVEFIGPWDRHDVIVNGFRVPDLTAIPERGGRICLILDHRYSIDLTMQEADTVVPFLADCMAVARGYTCHPKPGWDGPKPRPPMQPATRIEQINKGG
jgi:hypothetical protein